MSGYAGTSLKSAGCLKFLYRMAESTQQVLLSVGSDFAYPSIGKGLTMLACRIDIIITFVRDVSFHIYYLCLTKITFYNQ